VLRARGIVPLGRVLIHGPAGSGRELLARAVAEELHLRVYHINLRELAAEDHDVVEGALSALAQDAGRVRAAYLLEGVDMLDAGGPARAAMLLRRLLDQPRPSDSLLVCLAEGEVSPSLASRFDLVWETEAGPG